MNDKLVRYTVDLDNPPPLTEEEKVQLASAANMGDTDIDYSDAPPLPHEAWELGLQERSHRLRGTPITISPEVLEWLQSQPIEYQARIERFLGVSLPPASKKYAQSLKKTA